MIYKLNKIDPFFPIIKNYDTTFTQSQKTVYLIFSYLYNKNNPRSIYQFFFLLQFNPNHRFKSRTKSQTRWPGSSRQLESNGLDFPFPIPRSRPRYFLHSRSLHGQKTRATRAALRSR